MNRAKRILILIKCFVQDYMGIVSLFLFHMVVSACFLICFFSVGLNLYTQVEKLQENVGEESHVVIYVEDVENEKQIINCLKNKGKNDYCLFGEVKETKENEYSIGMYEDYQLIASEGEEIFLYHSGELADGVVIQSALCEEWGMDPKDLQREFVELNIGEKTKQYKIAAVLDSERMCAFQNYEMDIYIPRQLLDKEEEDAVSCVLMQPEDYQTVKGDLEALDCYVIESASNLQKITDTVKLVKILICFFGVFFGIVVSIQVVDLIGLLLEKNRGKFFMLSALGYYEKDMKKTIYCFCVIMAFIGTILGFIMCSIWSRGMVKMYQDSSIFGVSLSELLRVKSYIAGPCFIVLCVCVLLYAMFNMKELNGENIGIGLNEME